MVSIIVPIYNAEKTLARCVNSIISQTYEDIEVILVDDGSTDNSFDICKQFAIQDSRVNCFTKINGGVSSTRNFGLDVAKGEYIQFVDSDDYILPETTKTLVNKMIGTNVDMVICGYEIIALNKQTKKHFSKGVYVGKNSITNMLIENFNKNILNPIWAKLYKKDLILNKMETQYTIGEDLIFNVSYMENVNSLAVIDECLYMYDCRDVSLTRSKYKLNETIINNQYNFIKQTFAKLYDSLKLINIVNSKHVSYLIDDFEHKNYSVFIMAKRAKEFFFKYKDVVSKIEPISKKTYYVYKEKYHALSFYLFMKRIKKGVKDLLKLFIYSNK